MSKVKFTLKDLIQKVRELVKANPDYKYERYSSSESQTTCSYIKGGTGRGPEHGCLFGRAFVALDPKLYRRLEELEDSSIIANGIADIASEVFGANLGDTIAAENDMLEFCSEIQQNQDNGTTWKFAWDDAIEHYPRVKEYLDEA